MDNSSLIKKYVSSLSYENLQDIHLRMSGNFSGDYFQVFKKFETDDSINNLLLSANSSSEFYSLLNSISSTLKKEYELKKKKSEKSKV